MIPLRTHAIIDYVVGVLLILAPFILGFAYGGPVMWVPIILGASILVYSLFTRYQLSISGVIPFSVHLGLDVAGGLVLLVSPWLFGFADVIWWPHVLVGVAELLVVAMTDRSRPDVTGTTV